MVVHRPVNRSNPFNTAPDNQGRITIPKLVKDPVASLQPVPIIVSVLGQDFAIPALTAADWLTVLFADPIDPEDIFPGLTPDAIELVEDALYDGSLSLDDLHEASLDAIAMASGREWYITLRLISVARQSWDVLGAELTLKGVDAAKLSLSAWLDALLLITLRSMDPKDVTMFNLKLEAPLEGDSGEEPEIDRDAFLAMARD